MLHNRIEDEPERWAITGESVLYIPGILENIMRFVPARTLCQLFEMNPYLKHAVHRFIREVPSAICSTAVFAAIHAALPEDGLIDPMNASGLRRVFENIESNRHNPVFTEHISRIAVTGILSVLNDVRLMQVDGPLQSESNLVAFVLDRAESELAMLLDPTCLSALTAITDLASRAVWAGAFGQRSLIPFEEFYNTIILDPQYSQSTVPTDPAMLTGPPGPLIKRGWSKLLDFPSCGFVTPYRLQSLLNRFSAGNLAHLIIIVNYMLTRKCYMGFCSDAALGMVIGFDDPVSRFVIRDRGASEPVEIRYTDHGESLVSLFEGPHMRLIDSIPSWLIRSGYVPSATPFFDQRSGFKSFADYNRLSALPNV